MWQYKHDHLDLLPDIVIPIDFTWLIVETNLYIETIIQTSTQNISSNPYRIENIWILHNNWI